MRRKSQAQTSGADMIQTIALAFLAATAIGGIAWVFIYPMLSGEKKAEARRANVSRAEAVRGGASAERMSQGARRTQVEETLKEIDEKHRKQSKLSINARIAMAGLSWSKRQFVLIAIGLGIFTFVTLYIFSGSILASLAFGFAAGAGLPFWILKFLRKRRENKFLEALPDAVDVIVRGVRSGLPLFDSIKVVAADAPEPLRSEFQAIVETQTVGMPLGDACLRLYERVPLPESNFFGIVIAIQQKSGGNLSEALGNLSRVLRDRKKMKAKIQAMSMEAKASAGIIGALPPAVMILVYISTPKYIEMLWLEPMGRVVLAVCLLWMAMGIGVMKKMINFDF
jgi:tight adherence protein B